jgi:hypothetical protein
MNDQRQAPTSYTVSTSVIETYICRSNVTETLNSEVMENLSIYIVVL